MNDKIAKTMLGLCIGYLSVFYVLKFFFPDLLIQVIASPTLIRLGEFIGIWIGFDYIVRCLSSFIVYYLFACASSGKFKFKLWQVMTIVGFVIVLALVYDLLPQLYTHTSISLMLITALICNGKLLYTVVSFVIHGFLTQFLLAIRGFETIMLYFNPVSGLLINLEVDLWLVLLAIIFYLKEKETNGNVCTPLCEQAP